MDEGLYQPYDEWIKKAIEQELIGREDLLPPWIKYPGMPRFSIGWRMGNGESYNDMWNEWIQHLDQGQKIAYFRKYAPIPTDFLTLVAEAFGFTDIIEEILSRKGEFAGIRWLEQQKLANYEKFMEYYTGFWNKSASSDEA